MDSFGGSWTALFTSVNGTSWDDNGWTVLGFNDLAQGSHTIYFKASDDTGNVEGESGEWSWQFYKDTIAPADPTGVSSTTHTVSTWSTSNAITITWTDATDSTSGLDGYSILWNTSNSTIPDPTKDIEEGVLVTTNSTLADGNSHYFHIRSVDNAGNWQSAAHLGPFFIDTTPPTDPTGVSSPSHTISIPSANNTITVTWTDATDSLSDLDGYSILWNTSNSTIPDPTQNIEEGVQTTTSSARADGNSHYFHIRSKDNAGNWQSTVHLGPFFIDATPPTMEAIAEAEGEYYNTAPVFSNFGFDDNVALDDGGYQINSYNGTWTALFSSANGTSRDDDGWAIPSPEFDALAEGSHTIYFKASDDNTGNVEGESGEWSWQFFATDLPVLRSGAVSPTSGYTSATFTYSVTYADAENDAPNPITVSINGGASANMTVKDGEDGDFTNGEIYEYTITGTNLGVGTHTFQFAASDGTDDATGDVGSHSGPTVSSPGDDGDSGGGSSGGGGGVTDDARITGFGDVRDSGELVDDIVALSLANKLRLDIPAGTFAKTRNNVALHSIRVKTLAEPPEVSENMEMLSLVYELLPAGATFDPPITLTIKKYDTSKIPQGVSEENLVVATWDQVNQKWVELESTVDPETHTISTKISHFSIVTVIVYTRPASFTVTDLSLTPGEVNLGESVSISVLITNTGDLTGSYEVILKIDDAVVQTKEITLDGGDSETISFSVTPDTAGEHTVNIGDLLGTCKVKEPMVPPTPTPTEALPPTPAPASFAISDLSVTPSEIKPAEQVTISALVTNTGDSEGSYTVVLKINGAEEAKKEVTLGAGSSESVTFTIAKDTEGSYTVNIDGKVGRFTVIVPLQPPTNWGLIGGIIAGCVVAGLLVYFFVWRKRVALKAAILNISTRRRGS